jgi:hypothetical protein
MKAMIKRRGTLEFYAGSSRSQKKIIEMRFRFDYWMCRERNPYNWETFNQASFCSEFSYGLAKKKETGDIYIYRTIGGK